MKTNNMNGVWSVVQTGSDHGYATEVKVFDSKEAAKKYLADYSGQLVRGTQMWNEPVGQTEEEGDECTTQAARDQARTDQIGRATDAATAYMIAQAAAKAVRS